MVRPDGLGAGAVVTEQHDLRGGERDVAAAEWGTSHYEQTPALAVRGISKRFGETLALDSVDLVVEGGQFVSLLGPSGCGKSTLLRLVAGLDAPSGGSIEISGRVVSDGSSGKVDGPERRNIGMVFQSYALWPHMTVTKNVQYPLRFAGVPKSDRGEMARSVLDVLGLGHLTHRYPGQLSGGQQQRVALARAIVGRPGLLLLDEPLSNVDARVREDLRIEIRRVHQEFGLTALYVTHDQSEALSMSDQILVMDGGRALQLGRPEEIFASPNSLVVATFLGMKNQIDGVMITDDAVRILDQTVPVRCSGPKLAPGDRARVVFRADGFERANPDGRGLDATVVHTGFLGDHYEHQLRFNDGAEMTSVVREPFGSPGTNVRVVMRQGAALAFPAPDQYS